MGRIKKQVIGFVSDAKEVTLLDLKSNRKVMDLHGHEDYNFSIDFHPSNEYQMATGSQDTTTIVWDLRKPDRPFGQIFARIDSFYTLAYSHDGKYLYLGEGVDTLHVVDTRNFQTTQQLDFFGSLTGIVEIDDEIFFAASIGQYYGIFQFARSRVTLID